MHHENTPAGEAVPTTIGDYRLLREIGSGAQGKVWLATDPVGRRVALKRLRPDRRDGASRREEEALALCREIRDHAHLLQIYHVGVHEGSVYYSMELADSWTEPTDDYEPVTLASYMAREGPLTPELARVIMLEVLEGLRTLHSHGLLHRDVKPSNILRVQRRWKLADLGLMAREEPDVSLLGTIEYIPPDGLMDRTTDLYACGKVLYCLATGLPAKAYPSLPAVLTSGDTPGARPLVGFINRACALHASSRFQSVSEFAATLRDLPLTDTGGWTRRRTLAAAGLGVAVAAPLAAAAWSWLKPRTRPSAWRDLFNGHDLSGWYVDDPIHGEWYVEAGKIRCRRTPDYKLLTSHEHLAPGTLRVAIVTDHPGARMGVRYASDQPGKGHLFMLMGDKYTWIRGSRIFHPPEEPGNWYSFPGMIPNPGECVTLEVEWGPRLHELRVNGVTLYTLPPTAAGGYITLDVWSHDSGAFESVQYLKGMA